MSLLDFALDFATIPLWLQVLAYVYFVGRYNISNLHRIRYTQEKTYAENANHECCVAYYCILPFSIGTLGLLAFWVIHIHVHLVLTNIT